MKNKLDDNNLNLSGGISISGVGKRALHWAGMIGVVALGAVLENKYKVSDKVGRYAKKGVRAFLNKE